VKTNLARILLALTSRKQGVGEPRDLTCRSMYCAFSFPSPIYNSTTGGVVPSKSASPPPPTSSYDGNVGWVFSLIEFYLHYSNYPYDPSCLIRSVVTIYRYDRVTDAIDPEQTYNRPYETPESGVSSDWFFIRKPKRHCSHAQHRLGRSYSSSSTGARMSSMTSTRTLFVSSLPSIVPMICRPADGVGPAVIVSPGSNSDIDPWR